MTMEQIAERVGLIGMGYEGRSIDDFVEELHAEGVSRLVDVRLTPISRKRGFSKTALNEALAGVGIAYEHRPELGNPKSNRAGFGGTTEELAEARAIFRGCIGTPAATLAIDGLAAVAQSELVALLCFEADQHRCHRDVVLSEVHRRTPTAPGSTRRAH